MYKSNHPCQVCGGDDCPFNTAQPPEGVHESHIPHQIHVTVDPRVNPEIFRHVCSKLPGVKSYVLKNVSRTDGEVFYDLITAETTLGLFSAQMRMENTVRDLIAHGLPVIRQKIEAAPWHPRALTENLGGDLRLTKPNNSYFEAHVKVNLENRETVNDNIGYDEMIGINFQKLHVALGQIKKKFDDSYQFGVSLNTEVNTKVIVTLRRSRGRLTEFTEKLTVLSHQLHEHGFSVIGNQVIEFAVHDDNPQHDESWMPAPRSNNSYMTMGM